MDDLQLTLFPPSTSELSLELSVTKQQIANVRKGLFRRYGEINDELNFLRDEIKRLSSLIDKSNELIRSKVHYEAH